MSDEDILHELHQFRAECKYVPPSASAESLLWLREKEKEARKEARHRSRTRKNT
jgi:hypothetical protein